MSVKIMIIKLLSCNDDDHESESKRSFWNFKSTFPTKKWHTLVWSWIFHFKALEYLEYVQRVLLVYNILCINQKESKVKSLCVSAMQGRFCERNTLVLRFYEICQTSESNTFGIQQRNPSLIFTAPIVFLSPFWKELSSFCKLSILWEIHSSIWTNTFGSPLYEYVIIIPGRKWVWRLGLTDTFLECML